MEMHVLSPITEANPLKIFYGDRMICIFEAYWDSPGRLEELDPDLILELDKEVQS